ncbi:hypothetical protein Pan44_08140 [Caulifigura coniformis]|uniref:Uncharacterized protein n=1 Tax=Caulifigura coniformis TaxID=2527983 RepID=A0A517S9M3_9PLAN|nr:hypothetical protein [Caulifigura coniformis]QDT52802.1 hypothetical protein Pan44_08140 [Caulifigura coniformis]
MKTDSPTIAFRVTPEVAQQIDTLRLPLKLSRGEWVRLAAVTQLQQTDVALLSDQIDEMRQAVASLNDDLQELARKLAKTAYLILTNERLSPDEAKSVIRRYLTSEEGTP